MKVSIQATHDNKLELECTPEDTILGLKEQIGAKELAAKGTELPPTAIRLIFAGKILKDHETVAQAGIKDTNTIHMVRSQKKAEAVPAVSSPARPAAPPAQPPAGPPAGQELPPELAQLFAGGGSLGAMPDINDPAMLEASTQMMQDPEMRRQVTEMVAANPELVRAALHMNPAFAQMPPEMQEMMMNPSMIRMMMEMQPGLRPPAGSAPGPTSPGLPAGFAGLVQSLGGAGGLPAAPATPSEPPETRFASQLQQLQDMGFYDKTENIQALLVTGGNVNAAIERLLANPAFR